jgi:superfamily II DNA/RNA helicase
MINFLIDQNFYKQFCFQQYKFLKEMYNHFPFDIDHPKIIVLIDLLKNKIAKEDKVLLFVDNKKIWKDVAKILTISNIKFEEYTGEMSLTKRNKSYQSFSKDPEVKILLCRYYSIKV